MHIPHLMLRDDLLSSLLNFRWGTRLFRMTSATTEGPSVVTASTTCMWVPGAPRLTHPCSRHREGHGETTEPLSVIQFPKDTVLRCWPSLYQPHPLVFFSSARHWERSQQWDGQPNVPLLCRSHADVENPQQRHHALCLRSKRRRAMRSLLPDCM